ncbi:MAG: creatininase family protein [Saprospiraceae bacterium]|nr:creatininase family protein [Saprospiraceae bacterium]
MPLGAIEWHGLHLPIGLDSMTSHGICLRVADRVGGLVMPRFIMA